MDLVKFAAHFTDRQLECLQLAADGLGSPEIARRLRLSPRTVDEETAGIWAGRFSRKLPQDIQQTALRKLRMLNNAARLSDLAVPPNNRLEALQGDRQEQHSIRINRQWRLCFVWTEGGPEDVEIVDYH